MFGMAYNMPLGKDAGPVFVLHLIRSIFNYIFY